MSEPNIYVGAKKAVLEQLLEQALREVRESDRHVSVTIYANPGEGSITFSDEDTDRDEAGRVTIEEG